MGILIYLLSMTQHGPVAIETIVSHSQVKPGARYHAIVAFSIKERYHIYSPKPQGEIVKPTKVKPVKTADVVFEDPVFPDPKLFKYPIGDYELYEDKLYVIIPFAINSSAKRDSKITINFEIEYQACTEETCLSPVTNVITGYIVKVSNTDLANFNYVKLQDKIDPLLNKTIIPSIDPVPPTIPPTPTTKIQNVGLITKYISGILVSFTPCVLPLLPITLSFFAYQSGNKKSKTIMLGLLYILGLSITFAVLGVIAALAGSSLGRFLALPYVIFPLAGILILLGLSMTGLFELRMPSFVTNKLGTARSGYIGALTMGSLFSVLAAPCVGPAILQILTEIATTANVYYGALSLFIFSLGIGTVLLIVAIFGSKIPKSGAWTYIVKVLLGLIIIGYAFMLIRFAFTYKQLSLIIASALIIVGVLVIKEFKNVFGKPVYGYFMNLILTFFAGFFMIGAFAPANNPAGPALLKELLEGQTNLKWHHLENEAIEEARREGKPLLVDFWAVWCPPCIAIQKEILNNPLLENELNRFTLLKMDLSNMASSEGKHNWERMVNFYKIPNPPGIVFYDSAGKLVENPKFVGYNFTLEEFKNSINSIK